MRIAVYIRDIEVRVGGTESYFASLFEWLQNRYVDSQFEVITSYVSNEKRLLPQILAKKLNEAFGTYIKPSFVIVHNPYEELNAFQIMKSFFWYGRYTRKFDICFNCSRNLMVSNAKKNYSIMHFPVSSYKKTNIVRKFFFLKFVANYLDEAWKIGYDKFLCNSEYTASWLKRLWEIEDFRISILYPPVQLLGDDKNKKRQIFVCSRIERSKSLHVLIKAFLELKVSDVTLIIAGAKLDEDEEYYQELKKSSESNNIKFKLNPSREELKELYETSMIFWHAKGFEVDEDRTPDLLEHFGITTVEAMSAGCIPIVINKGGQKEIVDEGINGFKWNSLGELIKKTLVVLNSLDTSELRKNAVKKSFQYGTAAFSRKLCEIVEFTDENEI